MNDCITADVLDDIPADRILLSACIREEGASSWLKEPVIMVRFIPFVIVVFHSYCRNRKYKKKD